jgi:hypothetical protein
MEKGEIYWKNIDFTNLKPVFSMGEPIITARILELRKELEGKIGDEAFEIETELSDWEYAKIYTQIGFHDNGNVLHSFSIPYRFLGDGAFQDCGLFQCLANSYDCYYDFKFDDSFVAHPELIDCWFDLKPREFNKTRFTENPLFKVPSSMQQYLSTQQFLDNHEL